jgi:diguanylate cyclase (GGDEF)-like protein
LEKLQQFDMESYRILAELSNAILFEWDITTDCFYVSANWQATFNTKPQKENFSKNFTRIFSMPTHQPDMLTPYIGNIKKNNKRNNLTDNYHKIEVQLLTKEHSYVWFQLRLLLRYDAKGLPDRLFGMMTDIDLQKKENEKLLYQAQTDILTGLYNKATTQLMISDYLKYSSLQNKNQALFIIDIDGFKEVNDHFGHLFGDAVIADLAHCIKKAFRKSDIVGRIGGDEFIVLFKNVTGKAPIQKKAADLIKLLQRKYASHKITYEVSASIGIVLSPLYGTNFNDLFRKADHALYHVKENGKNNFYFYHEKLKAPQYVSSRMLEISDIENKRKQKAFHENVIEYIFKILYRSKDADTAVNLIMEIVGRKYNIDRVFILEKNKKNEYCNTFEWCEENVVSRQNEQEKIPDVIAQKFLERFDANGLFNCSDASLLDPAIKEYFNGVPVKALLECAMMSQEMIAGIIGFEDHKNQRVWKEDEIEVLSFTAEILSTFLLGKRALDQLKLSHAQALEILDHIDSFIYIVDKNTHEILFLNKKAIDFFGTGQVGKNCYDFISCENTPCTYCPMLLLTDSIEQAQQDIYFPKRDLWVHSAVSKIHWDGSREVCLIHSHDITALKKATKS